MFSKQLKTISNLRSLETEKRLLEAAGEILRNTVIERLPFGRFVKRQERI